jgi:hypothetical protein
MPIHPHYGSERLEPEGMGEAAQELVAAVVMNDGFACDRAKARHAVREPSRHMATVQRQVGAAGPASHQQSFLCSASIFYHGDALVREKGALRTSMSNSAARPSRESRPPVRLRAHRLGESMTAGPLIAPAAATIVVLFVIPIAAAAICATVGWRSPPQLLFTPFSSTLGMIHVLLPFMALALYGVMRKIDRSYPAGRGAGIRPGDRCGADPAQRCRARRRTDPFAAESKNRACDLIRW